MSVPVFCVDSFCDKPFRGNPAGVCLIEAFPSDEWMQKFAAEMRLSETAFLVQKSLGKYDLRWFTPEVEVKLCGHATLASAHILYTEGLVEEGDPIEFMTLSGLLIARREGSRVVLDFPTSIPERKAVKPDPAEVLGFEPLFVGESTSDFLFLVAPDEETVLKAAPETEKLMQFERHAVIITARCEREGVDFVSRMFAPKYGIYEDPVTGSAHCVLTPYWSAQLGKMEMVAEQVSERGGRLAVRLLGERVELLGSAVTIWRGELGSDAFPV